ncbi:MAG: hypothetical protein P0S96_00240 [Simkaniaceae bacterium]|nr:hypothetical protein [Candidatus Sacchlamyda saccharinae]
MRKNYFSLLEICIGLGLATLLITTLFSSLRQLMQSKAQMSVYRQELHPYFAMHMRLNQIFESIPERGFFYTDGHQNAQGDALYFIFQNGVDPNPELCGEVFANLYINKEEELIFELKNQDTQTLLTNVSSFEMWFFDRDEQKWVTSWRKGYLPTFLKICIGEKQYSFILPKAKKEVRYS